MKTHSGRLLLALPFAVAVACGLFLSVASHALAWSDSSVLIVGMALAALLGLLGTPLLFLARSEWPNEETHVKSAETTAPWDFGELGQIYSPLRQVAPSTTTSLDAENGLRLHESPLAETREGEVNYQRLNELLGEPTRHNRDSEQSTIELVDLGSLLQGPRRDQDPANINGVQAAKPRPVSRTAASN